MSSWNVTRVGTAVFGGCLAGLGAFILADLSGMSPGPSYAAVGPRAFPGAIGAGLILVGLLQLRSAIVTAHAMAGESVRYDWRAILWVSLALAAPIVLLNWVGWIPCATLVFVGVARAFGSRRVWIDALIGLTLAATTFLLFNQVLGLNLPVGQLLSK